MGILINHYNAKRCLLNKQDSMESKSFFFRGTLEWDTYTPWKVTYLLEIDSWKMIFPFKMLIFRGHVHVLLGGDIFGISFSSTIEAKISLTSNGPMSGKTFTCSSGGSPKGLSLEMKHVTFHQLGMGRIRHDSGYDWCLIFCTLFIDTPLEKKLTCPHSKGLLKMMFLLPRWDMLVPW